MRTIKRHLQPHILDVLKSFPAVYINGPRQTGKTTLVRDLLAKNYKAKFLTFDDTLERTAAQRNPLRYMRDSGTPLIIDEVQLVTDIFRPLKLLIDEQRGKARTTKAVANGHYLLTGSANLQVIPELASAMAGRMATLTLLPVSAAEAMGKTSHFLERCFAKDFTDIKRNNTKLAAMMRRASYPELKNMPQNMVDSWFKNYIQKNHIGRPAPDLQSRKSRAYAPIVASFSGACWQSG